ncbi:hypothetical protein NP137_21090, partial [Salmonella enterica]|nr:hypothetical protein [Salmonella enterica]
ADRNRSHWSTSKTPSYTKSVSWQHHRFFGPVVIQPESSTVLTAASSSAPIAGREKGKKSDIIFPSAIESRFSNISAIEKGLFFNAFS